jgi:hypothetical protein
VRRDLEAIFDFRAMVVPGLLSGAQGQNRP